MRTPDARAAALLLAACLAAGCSGPAGATDAPRHPTPGSPAPSATSAAPRPAGTGAGAPLGTLAKYADAVDAAHRHGLAVWLETDLVTRWLQGPESLAAGVGRVAELARRPGVVGVKIADELGETDGLDSQDRVLAFLRDASGALRATLPASTKLLVDVVVPELGCMPGDARVADRSKQCGDRVRDRWPGATLDVVDAVVRSGLLDAVDVSTGLLDPAEYQSWGSSRTDAQRVAWQEIARRGWSDHVEVRARKAMAVPKPFGSAAEAAAAVPTFVDLPLAGGAQAVDIWTWRQQYDGATVGLMDRGLRANALWAALLQRRSRGAELLTHFSPSQLQRSLDADLAAVATVFSGVFVAAGTG